MIYRQIPKINQPLSAFVYGTNAKMTGEDTPAAVDILDAAYEAGFRCFDTANSYGHSEENIGKWLSLRGNREHIVLLDKGCNPTQKGSADIFSKETIQEQLLHSLDVLQTDHVEMYALHRDDPSKPVDEIIETLNELQAEGKIGQFGASNWTLPRLLQANQYASQHGLSTFSFVSPAYSLAVYEKDPWQGSVSISGSQNTDYRTWLEDTQMPVFNYSALARGFLSGKYCTTDKKPIEDCLGWGTIQEYRSKENIERLQRTEKMAAKKNATVSQIALAWLLAQPLNLFPLVGPSTKEHIDELISAFHIQLNQKECDWLLNGGDTPR